MMSGWSAAFAATLLASVVLLCSSFAPPGSNDGWELRTVQFSPSGSHLGVSLTDLDADRASAIRLGDARGVEVRRVEDGSPAQAAGLKPGDVLLTYNSEDILSALQLGRLVNETPPGRKVKIQYWRSGKTASVNVVLGSLKPPASVDDMSPSQGVPPWGVPDFPRMLMLWENSNLGIECEPLDDQIAEYFGVRDGVLVRSVARGYPAERAGLKAGDVITGIDTRSLAAPRDLISYLRMQHMPGKALVISVVRDHKSRTFTLVANQ